MSRSGRGIILAIIGWLVLANAAFAQNSANVAPGREEIQSSAQRGTNQEKGNAAQAVAPTNVSDGENTVESECGTRQECRAEQRDQDDLIAQQAMAEAASSQRTATWWQTGIGAMGVILLILTVIYTHLATRAAIGSVKTLVAVERARVAIPETGLITTHDGKTGSFRLMLMNTGRTGAALQESCITGSSTGLYADFKADNIEKHNKHIDTSEYTRFGSYEFDLGDPAHKFIVGYYKYSTIFSDKLVTDYFCFEVGDFKRAFENARARHAERMHAAAVEAARKAKRALPAKKRLPTKLAPAIPVPITYRPELDWPPDQD